MKKLQNTGFAHLEILVILAVMLTVGGVAGYLVKNKTHADTNGATVCGASYNATPYKSKDMNFPGYPDRQAVMNIYYSKKAYKMCGMLIAKNKAYGASKPMSMRLDWTTLDGKSHSQSDSGAYKYYAGPVYADLSNNRSMSAKATMTFGGSTQSVSILNVVP
jgi:hypothetical protein